MALGKACSFASHGAAEGSVSRAALLLPMTFVGRTPAPRHLTQQEWAPHELLPRGTALPGSRSRYHGSVPSVNITEVLLQVVQPQKWDSLRHLLPHRVGERCWSSSCCWRAYLLEQKWVRVLPCHPPLCFPLLLLEPGSGAWAVPVPAPRLPSARCFSRGNRITHN